MKNQNNIYENENVYGDEHKFVNTSRRLSLMTDFVKSLNKKPKKVLDLGCGTGYFSNEIKQLYPSSTIYGLDVSKKAIAIGKNKYKNINLIVCDTEIKFSLKSNSFDLLISGEHIEHLRDVDTYLSEANRVAKKGATLILTTPNLASWLNRILLLFGRQPFYLEPSLKKTLPILTYFGTTFPADLNAQPSGHLRLFTLDALRKLLKHYGFKIVDVKGTTMFKGRLTKRIDTFFSNFPSLAYGFVIKAKKT